MAESLKPTGSRTKEDLVPVEDWPLDGRFDFDGHAIVWGSIGDGPLAVVLHGTPFPSFERRRIAPWLARKRRGFYYDMLGHGRSTMPALLGVDRIMIFDDPRAR